MFVLPDTNALSLLMFQSFISYIALHCSFKSHSFYLFLHFRVEAERVRCRRLGGDGVGGRTNVVSDKEFADKNKALITSNHQKSGKRKQLPKLVTWRGGGGGGGVGGRLRLTFTL